MKITVQDQEFELSPEEEAQWWIDINSAKVELYSLKLKVYKIKLDATMDVYRERIRHFLQIAQQNGIILECQEPITLDLPEIDLPEMDLSWLPLFPFPNK